MCLRSRFQSLNLVQPCDECCSFVIFAGRPSVSEGASDADDLFNLADVCVATVDGITHSGVAARIAWLVLGSSVMGMAAWVLPSGDRMVGVMIDLLLLVASHWESQGEF